MSSDHLENLDELSELAAVLVAKIAAALSSIQPETEIRIWYRRGEQRWVEQMPSKPLKIIEKRTCSIYATSSRN